MTALAAMLAVALQQAPAGPASETGSPQDALHEARATYDYGNYAAAAAELEKLTQTRALDRASDQIEAYRLLGLASFFLARLPEAQRAFLNLLSLDPDFQMDPLYVPPQAVAAFEQVRLKNQALLDPIRSRRRTTQEALAQEEVARQRLLAQEPHLETPTIIRERIERPSIALALLPFGIGQFQNGNRALGITLAAVEALTLGTSIGCYLWIEGKRESTGFYAATDYSLARNLEDVQLATGAAFGSLWILGAVEALLRLRPPTTVREEESGPQSSVAPKVLIGILPGGAAGTARWAF